jgi:hypothetical protein
MNTSKDKTTWWQCDCGLQIRVTEQQLQEKTALCPQCGTTVGTRHDSSSDPRLGDTQTVNLGEMARMAQDGIDVGVSGEWDTTGTCASPCSGED